MEVDDGIRWNMPYTLTNRHPSSSPWESMNIAGQCSIFPAPPLFDLLNRNDASCSKKLALIPLPSTDHTASRLMMQELHGHRIVSSRRARILLQYLHNSL